MNEQPFITGQPEAAYRTVKNYILEKIRSGTWSDGQRVPSEAELMKQFGLSRMTVHRALRELTADQAVIRIQGVGTFVAASKYQSTVVEIMNIADEIRARGHLHSAEVLLLRQEKAGEEGPRFGVTPGSTLYHSVILHRENGAPVQLEDRFVNPAVASDYLQQNFGRMTPNEYLMRVAPLERVEYAIEAAMPDAATRKLLATRANEPCLVLHRRTWSQGLVASVANLAHPASRYRLTGHF
jgi:GntR family histidine utilization transcriptional repressor